jgi:hypothetical protein
MALRAAGGLYGQKTGQGWYSYEGGKKIEPEGKPAPAARPGSVWVRPSDHNQDLQGPFLEYLKSTGVEIERGATPSKDALIIITPVGYDVTTAVAELKFDGARTVAVDLLFGLKGPRTVMVSPATGVGAPRAAAPRRRRCWVGGPRTCVLVLGAGLRQPRPKRRGEAPASSAGLCCMR